MLNLSIRHPEVLLRYQETMARVRPRPPVVDSSYFSARARALSLGVHIGVREISRSGKDSDNGDPINGDCLLS